MRHFVASLGVLALTACSSGGSGGGAGGAAPATPEMTKSVTQGLASVQRVLETRADSNVPARRTSRALSAWVRASQGTVDPSEIDRKARWIEGKLNPDDCVFDLPVDQDPGAGAPPSSGFELDLKSMRIEIRGERCPLNALIDVEANKQGNNLAAKIRLSFAAKSQEMQEELQMKSMSLVGTLGGNLQQAGNGVRFQMRAQLAGKGESLGYGPFSSDVRYGMNGRMDAGSAGPSFPARVSNVAPPDFGSLFQIDMTENQTYSFGQGTTRLGSTVKMRGMDVQATFTVNGRAVSAEEYAKYASELSLPGFDRPGDESGIVTPIGTPLLCQLHAYDSAQVTRDQADRFIRDGSALPGFPLQILNACGRDASTELMHDGKKVRLSVSYHREFALAEVRHGFDAHSYYAQNDAVTRLSGQTGAVTHLLICQPVSECPR